MQPAINIRAVYNTVMTAPSICRVKWKVGKYWWECDLFEDYYGEITPRWRRDGEIVSFRHIHVTRDKKNRYIITGMSSKPVVLTDIEAKQQASISVVGDALLVGLNVKLKSSSKKDIYEELESDLNETSV